MFSKQSKRGVGEIVVENLPEAAALFRHGLCAPLTEADAVSLASTFENHLLALLARGEIVARHSVPAETPVHGKSSRFAFFKWCGILLRQSTGPTKRALVTEFAPDRKVGISAAWKTYLGRSSRVAAATAREHGCKGLFFKGKDDSVRLARSNIRGAVLSRRLAEELAMSEITKIKVAVTPSSGQEVGTCDDC